MFKKMAEPEWCLGLPASEISAFCICCPAFGFALRSLPSRYTRKRTQRQRPWLHVLVLSKVGHCPSQNRPDSSRKPPGSPRDVFSHPANPSPVLGPITWHFFPLRRTSASGSGSSITTGWVGGKGDCLCLSRVWMSPLVQRESACSPAPAKVCRPWN